MAIFSKASNLHDIRFGTDGWRALIAKEFTYKNLEIFANGLAAYLLTEYGNSKPLIVGHDARFLADNFAQFLISIINNWGINCLYIDEPVPTPVIAFAAKHYDSCGAITFTASHNPPEYMGIKYIPEYAGPANLSITNRILEFIEQAAQDLDELKKTFTIQEKQKQKNIEVKEIYFKHLRQLINFDAIKKANSQNQNILIYDPLHGCGINYTSDLLEEAGFKVITINGNYDPRFGGSLPDPSETRLAELKNKVIKLKANLGAANDGDADRFAFFDEQGNFYPANKSLPIILKYLIEYRKYKGIVARTLATTHLLDLLAQKFGLKAIETPVGFKWLCEIMRKEPTILCAEESGGMSILGHIPEKDGILAILLMAETLAITGKKLSTLWEEVQSCVGLNYFYKKLDLHLESNAKDTFMANFTNENLTTIAGFKINKIDLTEGAKIYLEEGSWFLVRPSGTEAMCRVYFESNNQENLEKIFIAIQKLVTN